MSIDFRVIQGCPAGKNIAPYIAIVCDDAKATVNSIYRGTDAERILNAHGKHSQLQLYEGWLQHLRGFNPANRPGTSTHEMRSDAVAYPHVPVGQPLPSWWMQGFDVNDGDVDRVIAQAKSHGWELFRPYPGGSEHHHLNFRRQPRPGPRTAARIVRLRNTLPRK